MSERSGSTIILIVAVVIGAGFVAHSSDDNFVINGLRRLHGMPPHTRTGSESPQKDINRGMSVTEDSAHVIRIAAVALNSPAEKAGIKAGDEIAKIDSDSGADLTLTRARDLLAIPGAHTLVLKRNGSLLRLDR